MLLVVMLLGLALAHGYLYWRLAWCTVPSPLLRGLIALPVFVSFLVTVVSARALIAVSFPAWLAWSGFWWTAVVAYLVLWLAVLEVPRVLGWAVRRWRRLAFRPRLAARVIALVACVATGVTVTVGTTTALGAPRVDQKTVPLAGLPTEFDGFRIAVVADTHLWPFLDGTDLRRTVDIVNAQEPDLVVLAGDLVDAPVERIGGDIEPLADLNAPHGVYYVTGNHEYFDISGDLDAWFSRLDDVGVRALRNERVMLDRAGARVALAGVNDAAGARFDDPPDYAGALDGIDTATPVILAAHTPAQALDLEGHRVDLQISGHTHGGQTFPVSVLRARENPVRSGLGQVGETAVYVTNGVGFYGPPVRVGIPPQVGLLTLTSA